jgi:protein arginine N-methyltransferase 2
MMDPCKEVESVNVDIDVQEILLAASQHDVDRLRQLLRSNDSEENLVNVKDPETGYTPLHAAIAACEPDLAGSERPEGTDGVPNGKDSGDIRCSDEQARVLEAGGEAVKFLLREGAIWNDLDVNDETPGCLARRLGLSELYELMVDAGVRAEMLLNRLDGYQPLADDDTDIDGDGDDPEGPHQAQEGAELLNLPEGSVSHGGAISIESDVTSSHYLQSSLKFQGDRLLDEDQNGVMMSWEFDIMAKSAKLLLPSPGLRLLNIGHGMGIIDTLFQALEPSSHHIVEAHPAVIAEMKGNGWYEKPGVVVHEGKWQDVLPKLIDQGETFDAIYYDTFAESYSDFREFFSEHIIGLLDPGGKWGFFNGMGADRQISYDVYQKVVEMDLLGAGFDIDWEEVKVPQLEAEWTGVRRKYWVVDSYRLPTCRYMD